MGLELRVGDVAVELLCYEVLCAKGAFVVLSLWVVAR